MEVRPGYKQTVAGVIPNDWDVDFIENLAHITTGGKNTQDRIADGQYPFFVRSQTVERINSYSFDGEAVLTAGDGVGTGKVFHYINGKFDVHQRVYRISDFSERLNGYFFYLYFSANFYNRIMQMTAKSSVDSVRMEMIARMPVPLPPTEAEQCAIVAALSDADALLGGLEQLIAKKRGIKQATMQQLLTGQTRLPGFSGEWEIKRLGEIGEISGAGVDKKVRPNEMPIRLLNYMDVYKKNFLRSTDFWHEVSARPDQVRRCSVQRGDVFFTPTSEVRDDIGHSAVATEDIPDVVYSYHVVRLRLFEKWDARFRAYVFKTKYFMDQASTQCEGSGTRYVITLPKFRSMTVRFPRDVTEQAAIAATLSDMDAELDALAARRDKTRALKQAMMQELLTGKTRLVSPEIAHA